MTCVLPSLMVTILTVARRLAFQQREERGLNHDKQLTFCSRVYVECVQTSFSCDDIYRQRRFRRRGRRHRHQRIS